jgi:hypothetical protein
MNNSIHPISPGNPWPRHYLIDILHTGLLAKAYRFVRQAALAWLTHYESDLYVRFLRAKALVGEGKTNQAKAILEQICLVDPEFVEAQSLRAELVESLGIKGGAAAHGSAMALGAKFEFGTPTSKMARLTPGWTQPLRAARHALAKNNFPSAERQISEALTAEPISPLVAVTHLQTLWSQEGTPKAALHTLAEHYHNRWPECVPIQIIMADSLMGGGQSSKAVTLLHRASANDPGGQVARRLWGDSKAHPYQDLWPKKMQAIIDISIPSEVAAALGWNLLSKESQTANQPVVLPAAPKMEAQPALEAEPAPLGEEQPRPPSAPPREEKPDPEPTPKAQAAALPQEADIPDISIEESEIPKEIKKELQQVADRVNLPGLAKADGRYPVYVVLTTRSGLVQKYGQQAFEALDAVMEKLVLTVRERPGWGSLLMYADNATSMAGLDLKPCRYDDAWGLKLALVDLDKALHKKGAMIGAVLIVGGPKVVPYHHLPNPTDDSDTDVPSDNPYATSDENYFIPEWALGRLPGDASQDERLLLNGLRDITRQHLAAIRRGSGWLDWLLDFFKRLLRRSSAASSIGYTAEVWQRAALSVFRTIGEPKEMITSPPVGSHNEIPEPVAQLGYFNLHGLVDAPDWYGHRDPTNYPKPGLSHLEEGPDYPIALRPADIVNGGRAPQVVFSEACYGTHIFGRKVEDSMALKFLSSGSQAVVGSTVTAYGSVKTPLIAADLLGKAFWQYLADGYPTGEALRRAKIHLAKEMHKRQGYLDGEDQKTLISFVLYGDPLTRPSKMPNSNAKTSKEVWRFSEKMPQVKTICDRSENPGTSVPIPGEVIDQVKKVVEQYLPGMQGAQLSMSHEQADCCCEGHECPTAQLGAKSRPDVAPQRKLVTLRKEARDAYYVHPVYARLTLDEKGDVVKMVVSR